MGFYDDTPGSQQSASQKGAADELKGEGSPGIIKFVIIIFVVFVVIVGIILFLAAKKGISLQSPSTTGPISISIPQNWSQTNNAGTINLINYFAPLGSSGLVLPNRSAVSTIVGVASNSWVSTVNNPSKHSTSGNGSMVFEAIVNSTRYPSAFAYVQTQNSKFSTLYPSSSNDTSTPLGYPGTISSTNISIAGYTSQVAYITQDNSSKVGEVAIITTPSTDYMLFGYATGDGYAFQMREEMASNVGKIAT